MEPCKPERNRCGDKFPLRMKGRRQRGNQRCEGSAHVAGVFDVEVDSVKLVCANELVQRCDERRRQTGVIELNDALIASASADGEQHFDACRVGGRNERVDIGVALAVEAERHVALRGTGAAALRRISEGDVEVRHAREIETDERTGEARALIRRHVANQQRFDGALLRVSRRTNQNAESSEQSWYSQAIVLFVHHAVLHGQESNDE